MTELRKKVDAQEVELTGLREQVATLKNEKSMVERQNKTVVANLNQSKSSEKQKLQEQLKAVSLANKELKKSLESESNKVEKLAATLSEFKKEKESFQAEVFNKGCC